VEKDIPWCIPSTKKIQLPLDDFIECHLADPGNFSYFLDVANVVSEKERQQLARKGLGIDNYTTEAFCLHASSIKESRVFEGFRLAGIPDELVKDEDGFKSYTDICEIPGYSLDCLKEAINILSQSNEIFKPIQILVKSLHILKATDDDTDISYSLPNIPFSIFVSVPAIRVNNDSMRVAEGILHEAMHLQLSLIEKITPLVIQDSALFYSPWKGEHRNAQGIIHALYVFRAVQAFYKKQSKSMEFASNRIDQIDIEISSLYKLDISNSLTEKGNRLINALFKH